MPPDWAVKRACEITNEDGSTYNERSILDVICGTSLGKAFARYIASKEEPPVDPKFEAAFNEIYDDGTLRTNADVIRAALKRGMELAKEQSNG